MPYIHFTIEMIIVAAGAAIIWFAYKLAQWERWDYYRRQDRQIHRNLNRMAGR